MKYIVIGIMTFTLTACGWADKMEATATGYSDNCVKGVMYYQFRNGATVAYNTDGTIKLCD